MNFTWLNKQGVENENGEVIQFTGRFSMEYRNGLKVIELGIESGIMGSTSCISYSRKDFEKWSNGGGLLSPSENEQALNTFREALKFQGLVPDEE
jgi:hypothetical protein